MVAPMPTKYRFRFFSAGICSLPLVLSACSGGAPSKEDMAQLEADFINQPRTNFLFGGPIQRNNVSVQSIKIVKHECKTVKDFDSAFDCSVSFTLNDEPMKNHLRVIHHDDGQWRLAREQPLTPDD